MCRRGQCSAAARAGPFGGQDGEVGRTWYVSLANYDTRIATSRTRGRERTWRRSTTEEGLLGTGNYRRIETFCLEVKRFRPTFHYPISHNSLVLSVRKRLGNLSALSLLIQRGCDDRTQMDVEMEQMEQATAAPTKESSPAPEAASAGKRAYSAASKGCCFLLCSNLHLCFVTHLPGLQ